MLSCLLAPGLLYLLPLLKMWLDANGFFKLKRTLMDPLRDKARFVAKHFHQNEGLDYQEAFSPFASPVIIRLLLTFVVQFNWFLN